MSVTFRSQRASAPGTASWHNHGASQRAVTARLVTPQPSSRIDSVRALAAAGNTGRVGQASTNGGVTFHRGGGSGTGSVGSGGGGGAHSQGGSGSGSGGFDLGSVVPWLLVYAALCGVAYLGNQTLPKRKAATPVSATAAPTVRPCCAGKHITSTVK